MSKEEIALQLTLSQIANLHPTVGCASSPNSQNANFNKSLGEEIANMYNAVYNNLDCSETS